MQKELFSRLPQASSVVYLLLIIADLLDFSSGNNLNCSKTTTRPFYLIGHMCNSIEEVKKFVSSGANSVEIDFQFTENGILASIYHGVPCDCFRYCLSQEEVDVMIDYLKRISTPGNSEYQPHFTLALFDLKIRRLEDKAKHTAGIMMADKLIDILFESEQGLSKLKIVLGLEMTADYPFVLALMGRFNQRNFPTLLDRIGFDVSGNENIDDIEYLWTVMFENKLNVWQGDGITNCLSYARPTQRIKKLLKIRNENRPQGYVSKVYHWTIDSKWTIRESLRLGVDGMITNKVDNVLDALNDSEFKMFYHLATNDDDPFCVVRELEVQTNRKQSLYNKLLIGNYVMQNNDQAFPLTTSQTLKPKPFLSPNNNNFETDNLIRTGNDFKRNSFSDINFRQLILQFLAFINERNKITYEHFLRLTPLGRAIERQNSRTDDLNSREFQSRAALIARSAGEVTQFK